MFKWIKLIKWIKAHRKEGLGEFIVHTTNDRFIIVVPRADRHKKVYEKNRLEIKY